jgi:hypothetical protein
MNHRFALQVHAGVVLLAAALSNPCLAQSSMSRVTITHVRPDMLTEWVDLQKNEVVPALKKAGEKTRTVYVSGLFGSSYEYVIITPIASFAQFDGDSPILKTLGPAPRCPAGREAPQVYGQFSKLSQYPARRSQQCHRSRPAAENPGFHPAPPGDRQVARV